MRVKLGLPYYATVEDAKSGPDMTDEEYSAMLLKTFGGAYNGFMDSVLGNDSRYAVRDVMPNEWGIESVEDHSVKSYYYFDCDINDDDDKPITASGIEEIVSSKAMTAMYVHMNIEEKINPDAVSELNFWLKDSRGIMSDQNIDDDHKLILLPHKDLMVDTGHPGGKYIFSGCRVIDQDSTNNFAILVNNIKHI